MKRTLFVLALCLSGVVNPAPAQTPAPAPRQDALTVSGSLRARAESWDWFGASPGGSYTFFGSTLRAALARQGGALGWRLELAAPVLIGLPQEAVAPAPQGQLGLGASYWAANDSSENVAGVFLKQAFLRFGPAQGRPGHSLRLGRFEFAEGAEVMPQNPSLAALKRERIQQRLLGNFGFSHVGRSFDGLHYAYEAPLANFTATAVRPTRGVFDVNGWPQLDVGVLYAALTLPRPADRFPSDWRVFALHYADYRDDPKPLKVDNRPLAVRQADQERITVTTFGWHYLVGLVMTAGTADLLLWSATQVGSWGELDHRASAVAIELGFQPNGLPALRPWLRAGIFRSDGDDDPTDDEHRTFFQVLPSPRPFARFPFYNLMNVQDLFGSLVLRPSERLTLRSELHALRLVSGTDLWYTGGGAFNPGTFGFAGRPAGGERDLGVLLDLSADLRLTSRLSASLYLGRAARGAVIERIYTDGGSGRFGLAEVEYRW